MTINKRDAAEYFGRQQLLDGALAPFKVTDTLGSFDVIALCDGGGISGQAGALRLGIARALLNAGDYRADLKRAGFLTRDARVVERKKCGLSRRPVARLSSPSANFFSKKYTLRRDPPITVGPVFSLHGILRTLQYIGIGYLTQMFWVTIMTSAKTVSARVIEGNNVQ